MVRSDLAVVVPCHNEAETLGAVVKEAVRHGRVFVVDDRSTDGSARIAAEAGATVLAAEGRGYDAALTTGLRHVHAQGFKFAVTLDADGEHDPRLVKAFRARMTTNPLVLGVRPKKQRIAEALVGFAALSQFGVADILCGMKGYTRPVLDAWIASGAPLNINMTPAVLWRARGGGFDEIPVTGTPRPGRPRFGRAPLFSSWGADWAILRAYARALAA